MSENDELVAELLRCRCAECETGKQKGCNSSRLKELLGGLFDQDLSLDGLRALYCKKNRPASAPVNDDSECRCAECELSPAEGRYYCHETLLGETPEALSVNQ